MPCEQELLSNYHYKSIHPGMLGVYAHTHMPELFVSCWHGDFIGSKCLVAISKQETSYKTKLAAIYCMVSLRERKR